MSKAEELDKNFELAIAQLHAELEMDEISEDHYETCLGELLYDKFDYERHGFTS